MERMGLRTLSITLAIISSLLFRLSSLEYVNPDSKCFYLKTSEDIEYQCPKDDMKISLTITTKNHVAMQCIDDSRPFFDTEILPDLDLKESISFELNYCYLNISFHDILKKFNMNKVKHLSFTSAPNNGERVINVNKEMFEHMQSIENLVLFESMLNLSVDFLESTPNLRKLSLNRNGLTQIGKYFNHVPKLESLDLSTNQIDFIPDGVFKDLGNLVELHVWNNNLTSITKNSFKGLKSLQELWLTSNYIENIEEESFADMHKLVTISLQANNIQETHRHLFKNNKLLENIKLGHNNISVLSDNLFANLTSLQTIDLSFNKLREIPENIFLNCGKLRVLTLKGNRLSTIPKKTFLNLKSLKKLDISSNLLENLSDHLFSSLDNLEELYISNNQLIALDSDIFHKMGNMKILNLSKNNIGFIHPFAFRGLQDFLTHLDLSHNKWNNTYRISNMAPFDNCFNLHELILRNNTIREYPSILALLELKKLDLSFNLIKDLRVHEFTQSTQMSLEVDLTHNEIQNVDFQLAKIRADKNSEFYDASPHTGPSHIIHLDDNPISCDCSNIDLIRYNNDEMKVIKTLVDIKQDKLACPDIKNILVKDLRPNQIGCPVVQGCPSPCTCTYKPYNAAVIVDCSFKNLTSYPEFSINDPEYQQTVLNLRGNHLNAGPVENSNYENVTCLDLSQNHISEMSWIPPNIKELNLAENHLRKLDSHFVNLLKNRISLEQINLENNSWDCNCEASDLQQFLLQYYHKVNSSNVYCHNSEIQLVKLSDLCKTSSLVTVLLLVVLTILLCFTLALALYFRQKNIKIYHYARNLRLWFLTEEELDKDKTYDVFISYTHQDEKFDLIKTAPSPTITRIPPVTLDASLLEENLLNNNIPKGEGEDPLFVKKH